MTLRSFTYNLKYICSLWIYAFHPKEYSVTAFPINKVIILSHSGCKESPCYSSCVYMSIFTSSKFSLKSQSLLKAHNDSFEILEEDFSNSCGVTKFMKFLKCLWVFQDNLSFQSSSMQLVQVIFLFIEFTSVGQFDLKTTS